MCVRGQGGVLVYLLWSVPARAARYVYDMGRRGFIEQSAQRPRPHDM